MSDYALEMRGITKTFSKVTALDHVDLKVRPGEVHALIGENGAGKSTLMKVLSGAYQPDGGEIFLDGQPFRPLNPKDAIDKGVSIIYQELNLVGEMSAIRNVMLGHEDHNRAQFIRVRQEKAYAAKYLDYVCRGAIPDYNMPVKKLSVAQQQMVEIARALSYNARIIVMDEPTDTLTNDEIRVLFEIVNQLKADGITVIYISHRLEELFILCDRVTVLRDGKHIADENISDIDKDWLISRMIGRDLKDSYPPRTRITDGEPVLEVRDLSGNGDFHINLELYRGEIPGLAGLVGAGRTELAKMLCGDVKPDSGQILIHGKELKAASAADGVKAGIGLVPEDRKLEGVFLNYTIEWNIPVMSLKRVSKFGFMNFRELDRLTKTYVDTLAIKTPSVKQEVRNLSGGNQQKVVVAKVLAAENEILIFDEPTRGIDVGAKQEIYKLMNSLVEQGKSILMISSEMEELLGMSDRIVVLHEGRVTGELQKDEFSQDKVLELASGITEG